MGMALETAGVPELVDTTCQKQHQSNLILFCN